MKQPSKRTIKKFLDVIEHLDRFEATQRAIHKHKTPIAPPLPVPEVIETIAWLKSLANQNQRDVDP